MPLELEREIARLVRVLGRDIELVQRDRMSVGGGELCRIRQTCPLCDITLDVAFVLDADTSERWVRGQLFAVYDGHRCATTLVTVEEAYERAERESVRCGERVIALQQSASLDDATLVERAERESVRMAERAGELRRRL